MTCLLTNHSRNILRGCVQSVDRLLDFDVYDSTLPAGPNPPETNEVFNPALDSFCLVTELQVLFARMERTPEPSQEQGLQDDVDFEGSALGQAAEYLWKGRGFLVRISLPKERGCREAFFYDKADSDRKEQKEQLLII